MAHHSRFPIMFTITEILKKFPTHVPPVSILWAEKGTRQPRVCSPGWQLQRGLNL